METQVNPHPEFAAEAEAARSVRAVILLAGRVGRNPFADGVARSVLDLPVDEERTVFDLWIQRLEQFATAYAVPSLRLLVAVDQNGTLPRVRPAVPGARVLAEVVRDPSEYRGTAGVVKDLTMPFDPQDRVLVSMANQIQREPLQEVFSALCGAPESVSVVPHAGGEVAGMFLLRCARLRDVPEVGFVDLKEQAIPAARGHPSLHVARRPEGSTLPVRTLEEYIRALRIVQVDASGSADVGSSEDPFAETWKPIFSIVEPGAQVAPGAILHDSVVLSGARVEAEAAVARSVVCAGAVVRRGQCVLAAIVTP